jgi:hypothetical protein
LPVEFLDIFVILILSHIYAFIFFDIRRISFSHYRFIATIIFSPSRISFTGLRR